MAAYILAEQQSCPEVVNCLHQQLSEATCSGRKVRFGKGGGTRSEPMRMVLLSSRSAQKLYIVCMPSCQRKGEWLRFLSEMSATSKNQCKRHRSAAAMPKAVQCQTQCVWGGGVNLTKAGGSRAEATRTLPPSAVRTPPPAAAQTHSPPVQCSPLPDLPATACSPLPPPSPHQLQEQVGDNATLPPLAARMLPFPPAYTQSARPPVPIPSPHQLPQPTHHHLPRQAICRALNRQQQLSPCCLLTPADPFLHPLPRRTHRQSAKLATCLALHRQST